MRATWKSIAVTAILAALASAAKIAVMTMDFQFALIPGHPDWRAATGRPKR